MDMATKRRTLRAAKEALVRRIAGGKRAMRLARDLLRRLPGSEKAAVRIIAKKDAEEPLDNETLIEAAKVRLRKYGYPGAIDYLERHVGLSTKAGKQLLGEFCAELIREGRYIDAHKVAHKHELEEKIGIERAYVAYVSEHGGAFETFRAGEVNLFERETFMRIAIMAARDEMMTGNHGHVVGIRTIATFSNEDEQEAGKMAVVELLEMDAPHVALAITDDYRLIGSVVLCGTEEDAVEVDVRKVTARRSYREHMKTSIDANEDYYSEMGLTDEDKTTLRMQAIAELVLEGDVERAIVVSARYDMNEMEGILRRLRETVD